MSLQVKFKKISSNTKLPVKGSLNAAAYDVYASAVSIKEDRVVYHLGFQTEIPIGFKGVIVPRSNLIKHNWVMNNNLGVVDSDFRGEWLFIIRPINGDINMTPLPYTIGDRVAQIYFEKVVDVEFIETDILSETERNEGGFGSTGLK